MSVLPAGLGDTVASSFLELVPQEVTTESNESPVTLCSRILLNFFIFCFLKFLQCWKEFSCKAELIANMTHIRASS
jgi:hypothetical protein